MLTPPQHVKGHRLIALFAMCVAPMAATPMYMIQDLGTLGGASSHAQGINNAGQIVGYSDLDPYTTHAFRTNVGGGMVDLGALFSQLIFGQVSSASYGYGINSSGQVIGTSIASDNHLHAFRTNASGGLDDLGVLPGGLDSYGLAINDSGTATGYAYTTLGVAPGFGVVPDAFLTNGSGGLNDFGTIGTAHVVGGFGINSSGQVTGEFCVGVTCHAFRSDGGGGVTDLGTLGGASSSGWAINALGQVTGQSDTNPVVGGPHIFRTNSGGGMDDLGTLGGGTFGYGINSAGTVVGTSNSRAVIYDSSLIDLNTILINGVGWVLNEATAINDLGQIVGTGILNGQTRAFLLTPVSATPEPSTWALAVVGLAAVALRARRA